MTSSSLRTAALALAFLAACDDPSSSGRGVPARLRVITGDLPDSVEVAGAINLVVRVEDAGGRPVAGHPVELAVTAGGGTVSPAASETDGLGRVLARWLLGTTAGDTQRVQLRAVKPGRQPVAGTARAVAVPGAPAAIVALPLAVDSVMTSAVVPDTLRARVRDRYGNPIPGVSVRWGSRFGPMDPGTSLTDETGVARSVWRLHRYSGIVEASAWVDTLHAEFHLRAYAWPLVPLRVWITPEVLYLNVGMRWTVTGVAGTMYGTPRWDLPVWWSSSDSAVANVTQDGEVTAHALGSAAIYGHTTDGGGTMRVYVNPQPPPRRATLDAGAVHSCALTTAGHAYCWGENSHGQLGTGLTAAELGLSAVPRAVAGGHTFVALGARGYSTCGLTAAGAVYCWGQVSASSAPVLVSGGRTYREVDGRCGITSGGEWRCFDSDSAHLGLPFAALDGCALSAPAQMYCGFLPVIRTPPIQRVSGECGVSFAGKIHCLSPYAWVELGAPEPLSMVANPARFRERPGGEPIAVCALSAGGRTYCGGETLEPFAQADPYRFVSIAAGRREGSTPDRRHFCALATDGGIYCWGSNAGGELGDGTTTDRAAPVRVEGELPWATPERPPPGA